MAARLSRFSLGSVALLTAMAGVALPRIASAQEELPPQVENSKFQFEGVVNANGVAVHSGPNDDAYPTMKLDHGASVTVVGIRFDWLKIVPPPGSFCYVAQAFVESNGNGTTGRTTNTANVRIGSTLNAMKTRLVTKLDANTPVKILGKQDEYYKIEPPPDVYVYINKQYVDPVRQIQPNPPANEVVQGPTTKPDDSTLANVTPVPQPDVTKSSDVPAPGPNAAPTTAPALAAAPATQPTDAAADAQAAFDKLETAYAADVAKPLEDQNPAQFVDGYSKLASGGQLPDSLRKVAEYKAAAAKVRAGDRERYLAVKKEQAEMAARMTALKTERDELQQRVVDSGIKFYTAVGTLRASSLQQGAQVLYRLTDPANGRTVVYLRSNDSKLGTLMNQFIGVKGNVQDDAQLSLKVIDPTDFETVDQSKLYTHVAAQIVPPSLMPAGTAATGNQ